MAQMFGRIGEAGCQQREAPSGVLDWTLRRLSAADHFRTKNDDFTDRLDIQEVTLPV